MSLSYLRTVMAGESKAYGFTIAFWGSGIMLVDIFGMPGLKEALLFGLGAVIGFGILAMFAFRGEFEGESEASNLLVFSTTHYLSALIPVAVAYYLGQVFTMGYAFFLAGMNVSLLYNLLMVVEKRLAEEGAMLESKLENILQ